MIMAGLLITLYSCDPGADETLKITNKTNSSLTFIIEKKGYFPDKETYYFTYQNHNTASYEIVGDTILIVECEVLRDEELILFYLGPIGTIGSMVSKEDGEYWLGEICDTIFLKNHVLKKDIWDFDNWDIYVEYYKNGGGESIFNFIVKDGDIE
jgi:hypothetical protein